MSAIPHATLQPRPLDAGTDDVCADRIAQIYPELCATARRLMAGQRPNHTLGTTGLVHETVLRLLRYEGLTAATGHDELCRLIRCVTRRVLCSYNRKRNAAKRGGRLPHVADDEVLQNLPAPEVDWEDLYAALDALKDRDPRKAEIIELRYILGLTREETAAALEVSVRTVERDARFARAFLRGQLRPART